MVVGCFANFGVFFDDTCAFGGLEGASFGLFWRAWPRVWILRGFSGDFGTQFGGHRAHSDPWDASLTRIVVRKGYFFKALGAQLLRPHFLIHVWWPNDVESDDLGEVNAKNI